jgi:hypothetical protein
LVITEVMHNPNRAEDARGEWFEVYNPGLTGVNMDRWTISNAPSDNDAAAVVTVRNTELNGATNI